VTTPPTYLERLLGELDTIRGRYLEVLAASAIRNVDPNRPGSGVVHYGAPKWGWVASEPALEASRMELLCAVRDWAPRLRLLFPHPTPTVTRKLDDHLGRLERWLVRPRDGSIPATIDKAVGIISDGVVALRDLTQLLPADPYAVRLVVDTNSLIDNPDLAAYTPLIGPRYMAHLLPVVLREIDDHKRGGRTLDLREAAKKVDRRLKGLRTNGDVLAGVRVAGDAYVTFEHVEPKDDGLPSWLDLDAPDDRFLASTLLLQSAHPGSALYAATSDINLQTKLSAVGMPFVEVPAPRRGDGSA